MRIVFFGMPGRLAGPTLEALVGTGVEVAAVAVPAPPGAPPVVSLPPLPALAPWPGAIALLPPAPPGPLAIAAAHALPALALRSMKSPAVRDAVAGFAPDLVVVACWPWRIPPALLAVPRLGFLNLHPAPLPELRGPDPLFWALQEGRAHTAVTLHWMDEQLDTGDIAAAAPLELPEGAAWAELEDRAAATGAKLLAALVPRLLAGDVPRRPQPPGGSYRPAPTAADFAVDPNWPAARAYRFMRGTAAWGVPYTLPGANLRLAAALAYDPTARIDAPLRLAGATAHIQMTPGVLTATRAKDEG